MKRQANYKLESVIQNVKNVLILRIIVKYVQRDYLETKLYLVTVKKDLMITMELHKIAINVLNYAKNGNLILIQIILKLSLFTFIYYIL